MKPNKREYRRRRRDLAAYNPERLPDILPPEDDRHLVLFFLQSLYCMTTFFPWKSELIRAQETGDVAAVFELELKINTVARVLDARNAWWQEHADELPEIPADIRDGREVGL